MVGETETEPLVAEALKLVPEQLVAFVDDHVRVDGPPEVMVAGFAEREAVGVLVPPPHGFTLLGVPASKRALAGSVLVVPVVGSTHGQVQEPKKAGFDERYIEEGIVKPPGVLCQCWELVTKS
jgi:hypothetical protein